MLASCQAAGIALSKVKANDLFSSAREVAFAEAAARGQTGWLKELLDQGVDVNARGKDGVTPLLWALAQGGKPGFKYLLEHGANPNLQAERGDSAMLLGAMHEDPEYLAEPVTASAEWDYVPQQRLQRFACVPEQARRFTFR